MDSYSQPKVGSAIEIKTKANTVKADMRKLIPAQLAFWPDNQRAVANELARSALFLCRDPREKRQFFDNESLYVLGEGAITYKGEELRERDEDIWISLTHLAREMSAGKMVVTVSSSDICKQNNWRQDQRYYNEIFLSIQRMKGGVIGVYSKRLAKALKYEKAIQANASDAELARLHDELTKIEARLAEGHEIHDDELGGMMMSLIHGDPTFTGAKGLKNNIPQGNLQWEIVLDKKMVSLFAKPFLTLVDNEIRQELTATGKRLHTYFSSHQKPYPVKLRNLEKMVGMNFGALNALKANINKHLEQLRDLGAIYDFSYKKSADDTDWLVTVNRFPPQKESVSSK